MGILRELRGAGAWAVHEGRITCSEAGIWAVREEGRLALHSIRGQ